MILGIAMGPPTLTPNLAFPLLRKASSSTIPGLVCRAWGGGSGNARHLHCPIFVYGLGTDGDLLVNCCESKDLHLDIPNPWSQV
jgi:hypothetical protein